MIMWNQKLHINNIPHSWVGKKMVKCLGQRLGQATTEIAVFGIIILVVFGVLLRYAQMYNAQQEAQMYAFRKSLELAQKRYNDERYGAVTLVAMKEYLPVDLFSSEPQMTYATGSSSINIEAKQQFYERDNPSEIRENAPITYYQIGNEMIENNELIEAPYMFVKRKIDYSKGPRTVMDSTMDILNKIGEYINGADDDYDVYETVPFWETTQITNATYASQEQRTSSYLPSVQSNYSETSSKETNTATEYEVQPQAKIYASDELIEQIYSLPSNMVVEQNQTIGKERSYSAWD